MSSNSFDFEKHHTLSQLQSGIDYSPKGSIDAPILELVKFINTLNNYVTTSSCSGRISVYHTVDASKGISWLLVEHGMINLDKLKSIIHNDGDENNCGSNGQSNGYIYFKCEPLILHIQCRSIESASYLHALAMSNGFRESGISIGKKKFMVAIRTTSNLMELPIATRQHFLFSENYLHVLVQEANIKLSRNFERIHKLLTSLKQAFLWPIIQVNPLSLFYTPLINTDTLTHTTATTANTTTVNSSSQSIPQSTMAMNITRWGHTITPISTHMKNTFLCTGGNGHNFTTNTSKENTNTITPPSTKCNRKLDSLYIHTMDDELHVSNIHPSTMSSSSSLSCEYNVGMHHTSTYCKLILPLSTISTENNNTTISSASTSSSTATSSSTCTSTDYMTHNILLISGGRYAPTNISLNPILQIYHLSTQLLPSEHTSTSNNTTTYTATTTSTNQNTSSSYSSSSSSSSYLESSIQTLSPYEQLSHINIGDTIPCTRWGHTLTPLSDNTFLLYGGRDGTTIYNDCYILTLQYQHTCNITSTNSGIQSNQQSTKKSDGDTMSPSIVCIWRKIQLNLCPYQNEDSTNTISEIQSRFFHAAVPLTWYKDTYQCSNNPSESSYMYTHIDNSPNNDDVTTNKKLSLYQNDQIANNAQHTLVQAVLIHGGLIQDLHTPQTSNDIYVIYPFRSRSTDRHDSSTETESTMTTVYNVYRLNVTSKMFQEYNLNDIAVEHITNTTNKTTTDESLFCSPSTVSETFVSKFGHTMTDIGHQTVLLCGGTSFNNYRNTDISSVIAMHLGVNDQYNVTLQAWNNIHVMTQDAHHTTSTSTTTHKYTIQRNSDAYLPCSQCRVHHTATYCPTADIHYNPQLIGNTSSAVRTPKTSSKVPTTKELTNNGYNNTSGNQISGKVYLLGGGSMCLGFGPHYCDNILLNVLHGSDYLSSYNDKIGVLSTTTTNTTTTTTTTDKKKIVVISSENGIPITTTVSRATIAAVSNDHTLTAEPVIFVKTSLVKKGKLWCEKYQYIDKKRRITDANIESYNRKISIPLVVMTVKVIVENQPSVVTIMSSTASTDVSINTTSVSTDVENAGGNTNITTHDDSGEKIMAIPINSTFFHLLMKYHTNSSTTTSNTKEIALLSELSEVLQSTVLYMGEQENRVNKSLLSDGNRKATEFLHQYSTQWCMPESAKEAFPTKYEIIDDVLMIPDQAFHGLDWSFLNIHDSTTTPVDTSVHSQSGTNDSTHTISTAINNSNTSEEIHINHSDTTKQRQHDFWSTLASFFQVTRIAKKSRIDSGPKRESRIIVLWTSPEYKKTIKKTLDSHKETVDDTSSCWVKMIENKITYHFNLTKVMFCSGNVTERMRMAREQVKDQVIVDMYCGIGYYTLPFLIHGQAKHVHACEWNPNSLQALQRNLHYHHIASDRYTIYPGDNAISTSKVLNVADRICLGLLPSSTKSWPLAVQIAKPSSRVIIHVHENILDTAVDSWTAETIQEFESLFLAVNKPMKVTKKWLERVKSYAPHVIHVVLDLYCDPMI